MALDIANLVVNISTNKSNLNWDIVDVITITISILALFISIFQWYSNKQVSLKNEFIKNEKKILLDYRKKYIEAQLAFFWFRDYILTPMIYIHRVQEPLTISLCDFQNNYNSINELNNIYNLNQHILLKHNLELQCEEIAIFLDIFQGYNYGDFNTYVHKEENGTKEYRIDVFDSIIKKFTKNYNKLYYNQEIENFDKDKNYELFEKLRDKFFDDMLHLEFKLDEITLYSSNKNTKKKFRVKNFFPKYTKYTKENNRDFSETIINDLQ